MKTFCNGGIINLQTGVEPEKERILFMLIKEKNVLIVSIDHGFCSIKGPHFVMENGVTRIPTEPAFKENTIFYKGSYYKVGEGRLAMKDEKTEDDDYFILTLVAIAEELKRNGLHHHNNVVMQQVHHLEELVRRRMCLQSILTEVFRNFSIVERSIPVGLQM